MASDQAERPTDTAILHDSTRTMTSRGSSWYSPILITSSPPASPPVQLAYPVRSRIWDGLPPGSLSPEGLSPTLAAPKEPGPDIQTHRREERNAHPANTQHENTRPAKRARSMSPRPMPLQQASAHLQHASTHLQEPYKRCKTASLRLATQTQVDENIGVAGEPPRSTNSSSYGPADHSFYQRKSKNKTLPTFQLKKRASPSTSTPTTSDTSDSLPFCDYRTSRDVLRGTTSPSHNPSRSNIVPSQKFAYRTEEDEANTSRITLQPVPPTAFVARKRALGNKEEAC